MTWRSRGCRVHVCGCSLWRSSFSFARMDRPACVGGRIMCRFAVSAFPRSRTRPHDSHASPSSFTRTLPNAHPRRRRRSPDASHAEAHLGGSRRARRCASWRAHLRRGRPFRSVGRGGAPPSFESVFATHSELRRALGEHLDHGGELRLTAGNHDAEVGEPGFVETLAEALGLSPEARARVDATPWFFRDGGLHVEHGHIFDPDNAPGHPLIRGAPSLGVRFVHDFIAPTGAFALLNRSDKLPLELFVEAFTRYGVRGPYVIATFFRAAFAALANAGPFYDLADERGRGDGLVEAFAEATGVSAKKLRAVLASTESPTLANLGATFERLYLDRVAFAVALLASSGLALAGKRRAALALAALGTASMVSSWASSYNRYGGKVVARLGRGARFLAEHTHADLVVLGHAHHAEVSDKYANPGSFSFAPGDVRTFLELEVHAHGVRAELRGRKKVPGR